MQGRALLLATVLGALLLARSEAGPIKPVAQPEQESEYVMVKLLFEGELLSHASLCGVQLPPALVTEQQQTDCDFMRGKGLYLKASRPGCDHLLITFAENHHSPLP